MHPRHLISAITIAVVLAGGALVVPVAGQAPTATTPTYTPPRTPWGDPDLQGVYDFQTYVTMERPPEWAGKPTRTDEELAKWAKEHTAGEDWTLRHYVKDNRTALITDPPDGKLPLTPEGGKRYLALEEYRRIHQQSYETWAEIGSYEQCISRVIPRLYQGYNSGTEIVQSPGYVTIIYEQLDTRVIPLDGRPHPDPKVKQWDGDSVGHWEGDTLVVDVANFSDKQTGWPPMRDWGGAEDQLDQTGIPRGNLHMIERYRPVSATRLEYTVTNEDPTWFSRPWTFMLPWEREKDYQLYEYACTEGNLAVEDSLRGERVKELRGDAYVPPAGVGDGARNGRPQNPPRLPR